MEFFIDTANLDEIKQAYRLGFISGVTTNPSLVAKEKNVTFEDRIQEITEVIDGPISAEVLSLDAAGMVEEGKKLAAIHLNVTIKVPMTAEGLAAVRQFSQMNIQTNVTLIFSANQALLAARAGATFVSPFVGRLDDIGQEGMTLINCFHFLYPSYSNQNYCGFNPTSNACNTSGLKWCAYCNDSI